MKSLFVFLFTISYFFAFSQQPTDCVNSIIVCGNSDVNLNVSGVGTQEVSSCGSQENNSVWLKLNIATGGTLGFTLTPNSTAITEDYDFFVFGPNRSCGNLGPTIRCSTTNPVAAGSSNNLTGMNSNENDTSEGPGPAGNSFVQWLNVQAGDVYYVVIDRPIGSSPFSMVWTGTATFNPPPTGNDDHLKECTNNPTGDAIFDLTQNEAALINGQNVTATYYNTISDAQIGVNNIANTTNFSSGNGTVFVRLTNISTECFSVFEIQLETETLTVSAQQDIIKCNDTGIETFDLSTQDNYLIGSNNNTTISYYLSQNDANLMNNPITATITNTANPQTIWYRLDKTGATCFYIGILDLIVDTFFINPEPTFTDGATIDVCLNTVNPSENLAVNFVNNNLNDYTFLWSTGQTTSNIDVTTAGEYSVAISTVNACEKTLNFHVVSITINEPEILGNCVEIGAALFDFTEQQNLLLTNNTDVTVAFYVSNNDALAQNAALGLSYTNVTNPQTIYYRLNKIGENCFYIGTFEIIVDEFFGNPEPNFITFESLPYCVDAFPDPLTLSINFENNDINDYTYLWSTGETTSSIDVTAQGNYTVIITNQINCDISKEFAIFDSKVFANDEPNFIDETIYYCVDTYPTTINLNTTIANNDLNDFTFLWSNGATTESISINEIGNYMVEVFNADLCVVSRTVTVLSSSIPVIESVVFADTTNPDRVSIVVEVLGTGNYVYGVDIDALEVDVLDNYQANNRIDGLLYGQHIIRVLDLNGCGFDEITIDILSYPRFITPNDDGFYDTWNLNHNNRILNNYDTVSKVNIFDRFGKIMAIIDPLGEGWDGKYLGKQAAEADYWFSVDLTDFYGKTITKKGHFSLKY